MSTAATQDIPLYTGPEYNLMAPRWALCEDLYEGTEAIRAKALADGVYIIQAPAETASAYEKRIARTELFPAFSATVDGLTGIVFRVDPELGEDVPAVIQDHWETIDVNGLHGSTFAKECFRDALKLGHVGILVDAPVTPKDDEGVPIRLTLEEEQKHGVRPYWVKVLPQDILSWRVRIINGRLKLVQLVIREAFDEDSGKFMVSTVWRYKMWRLEEDGTISWRQWNMTTVQQWTDQTFDKPDDYGIVANQTEIPFVVIYGGIRLGPLYSRPPLLDLAHMNISHLNVQSDRRNGLRSALHPILVMKGRIKAVDEKGAEVPITLGPDVGIDLPASPDSDVFYAEHEGKSLGEARSELQDIEARMTIMGLGMLSNDSQKAASTATSRRIDKEEKQANLATAARNLQDGLEACLDFHAQFLRLDEGGSVEVNKRFELQPLDPAMVTAISGMVTAGQLSLETMWQVLKQKDFLPEDMDDVLELVRILKGQALTAQDNQPSGSGKTKPSKTQPAKGNAQ